MHTLISPPPAIVLAGGFGTRVAKIYPDLPKPLIPFHGKPFLSYVIDSLIAQGILKIFLSVGYKGADIAEYFDTHPADAELSIIQEPSAMGTGGAVQHVLANANINSPFFVLNGDSLVPFNCQSHIKAIDSGADAAIAVTEVSDISRYGSVRIDDAGMVKVFSEKRPDNGRGMINAGVYLFTRSLFHQIIAKSPSSLEHDYFPHWLGDSRKIAAVTCPGPFVDIGTPESLAGSAADIIASIAERLAAS